MTLTGDQLIVSEVETGKLLLMLAVMFAMTYLVGGFLEKLRIPAILGALLVAMFTHITPIGTFLAQAPFYEPFSFLAQLGVMFLLFFIGLQIDIKEMQTLSRDILWATLLNTFVPFILGMIVMLSLGYGWLVAFVIGLTRMPTAEAVIVPILDEFKMIRTRVGSFIIGAGVLDDIIEVFLISFISIWISQKTLDIGGTENKIISMTLAVILFITIIWISYRWLLPLISHWLPNQPRNLILLTMLILFGFSGFSEYSDLGIVVGAIISGVLLRPVFNHAGTSGEQTRNAIRAISYGFFGVIFFFWVGLSVDLDGMLAEPELAVWLFLAAFVGKLIGIFIMVPMKKLNTLEAWTIGIGLNARLTTEIIVAKILLDANLIDVHLFTALVAASSLSTIIVPLLFTLLIRKWGEKLLQPVVHISTKKVNEAKL